MTRQSRQKGENCIYHIIQRGNERSNIFRSDDDKVRFIDTLIRAKNKYDFRLYAYCLMDNHVHLIIDSHGKDISQIVKSINVSYAVYFNKIYQRCGHLFQDRFISEIIDNDIYLLQVSKYIHNNPVKALMVNRSDEYKWSSYNIYTGKVNDKAGLIDKNKILKIINKKLENSIRQYAEYVQSIDFVDGVIEKQMMDAY